MASRFKPCAMLVSECPFRDSMKMRRTIGASPSWISIRFPATRPSGERARTSTTSSARSPAAQDGTTPFPFAARMEQRSTSYGCILRNAGFQVDETSNRTAAATALRSKQFDLIVTDVRLGLAPIPWTPKLRCTCLLHELMFEVNRTEIAIVRMPPSRIVEALDVLAGGALDVLRVVPARVELELEGEGREEALGHRVVPAVPLAAHARPDGVALEQRSVLSARVVNATVAVMDHAGRRRPHGESAPERFDGDTSIEVLRDRPADDTAGEQIEHHGHVHEAGLGSQ